MNEKKSRPATKVMLDPSVARIAKVIMEVGDEGSSTPPLIAMAFTISYWELIAEAVRQAKWATNDGRRQHICDVIEGQIIGAIDGTRPI